MNAAADALGAPGDEPQLSELRSAIATAVDAVWAPSFLHQLDRLRLRARAARGQREGENPMRRSAQASGSELESHRSYSPGDDLRRIDWNAYARLDQLVVRLYRAERQAPHYLILDSSASMAFPPGDRKLPFGAALLASLAYAAVRNHDPVRALLIGSELDHGQLPSPQVRHVQQLSGLREFLVACHPRGKLALATGVHHWLESRPAPGIVIVASDFLMPPAECEAVLAQLQARRFDVACVRLLGVGERDPTTVFRRGRLVDAETGQERELRLDADNLARYQAALQQHLDGFAAACARHRVLAAVAETAGAPDAAVLRLISGMP